MILNIFRSSVLNNLKSIYSCNKRTFGLFENQFKVCTKIPSTQWNSARSLNYIPIESNNKISIGHKMTQVIDKNRQKAVLNELNRKNNIDKRKTGKHLLISSSSPSFNHFDGQLYKNFSSKNLASVSWKSRSSSGKFFTINANGAHPSLLKSVHSFEGLNLNQGLIELLKRNLDIDKPTYIQKLALNSVLNRDTHNLIVAETGGGKTLTYILPIIETCIRLKEILNGSNLKRKSNQPIGIVMVPSRELVFQVYKSISNLMRSKSTNELSTYEKQLADINFVCDLHPDIVKSRQKISNIDIKCLEDVNDELVDILITTPSQLRKRLENKETAINSVYLKQIVLDEADTLLDDSFNQITLECLTALQLNLNLPKLNLKKSSEESQRNDNTLKDLNKHQLEKLKDPSTQLLFVSATTPRDMKNILEDLIDSGEDNFKVLKTNTINKLMLHVPQKFLRLSTEKRNQNLLELVGKEMENKKQERTMMIFSHRTATAIYVSKFLKENGFSCGLLTKNMQTADRESLVEDFFNKKIRIICCTDIASRGWDTLHVNHVVNFEMPSFISDYIHRIGRVGRLNTAKFGGGGGLVTNYVTKPYEIDLVWNIERSVRLDCDLHNVNANAKRILNHTYTPKKDGSRQSGIIKDDRSQQRFSKDLRIEHE